MIRIMLLAVLIYGIYCNPIIFRQESQDVSFKEGDTCTVCHIVIDAITYDIKKYNTTIHDITELTKDLCKDIGGDIIGGECAFIINNIQKIIDWIQSGSSVDFICNKLNLCYYLY